MIKGYTNQQPTTLLYDNYQGSSPGFSKNIAVQEYQDPVRYGKPTYQISNQHIQPARVRVEQAVYQESPTKIRYREKSIKKDVRNRTPVKKYTVLKETPNTSYLVDQRYPVTQRVQAVKQPYFNVQRKSQPITIGYHPAISKPISDKNISNFPQPIEVQQKSPINRPKYQQKPIQKPQQNYFQYILEYSYRSKKGSSIHDPTKPNQDSYVASPNLNNQTWLHYFGVCDGHGPNGHLVSSYVKKNLPVALSQIKNIYENPKQQFMNAFKNIADRLPIQLNTDLSMSGSTSVGVYLNQNKLYCCNLGDSKAVLGSKQKHGKWKATPLSIDHKPDNSLEATRIIRSKGRIDSFRDQNGIDFIYSGQQVGPLRVWLKNQDIPGLAMTRCFGDQIAAQVGVLSIPQIREFTITEKDKIIIVASDGIWQFLNQQQVIDIIAPFYQQKNIEAACNTLLETAIKAWKQDNSEAIDDITFVLLFLDYSIQGEK